MNDFYRIVPRLAHVFDLPAGCSPLADPHRREKSRSQSRGRSKPKTFTSKAARRQFV
jgi:hypothetical protein